MSARQYVKEVSNIITTGHIRWKSFKNGIWVTKKNQLKSKLHYKPLQNQRNFNKRNFLQPYIGMYRIEWGLCNLVTAK